MSSVGHRVGSRPVVRSASVVGIVTLLVATLMVGAAAHSPGAAAPTAPESDRLGASLLTGEDVPAFAGRDIEDPTELDIDSLAFDEHRGIDVLARAWASPDQGVVFDYRMLFPTAEAALGYLAAAEPTLSEADDAGLMLVPGDPLTPATRHWAGETVIGAERVAMDVWLIPVGPVVAKVAATVFGPGLDARRVIAERALVRLEAAFGPAGGDRPSGDPLEASPAGSPTADVEAPWEAARFGAMTH